ncbi:hypothetical protein D3C81_1673340 [compost metagenome]
MPRKEFRKKQLSFVRVLQAVYFKTLSVEPYLSRTEDYDSVLILYYSSHALKFYNDKLNSVCLMTL